MHERYRYMARFNRVLNFSDCFRNILADKKITAPIPEKLSGYFYN